jgi:mannosyltransferase OCH1-like enzyme
MIPKIIHIAWFGDSKKLKMIEGIETLLNNDYEMLIHNESFIFDLEDMLNTPIQPLLNRCRNYSEMSDIVRLYALYYFGGIYMDTDFIVYKDFTPLLNVEAFAAKECDTYYCSALIGAEPEHKFIKSMIDWIENTEFEKKHYPWIIPLITGKAKNTSLGLTTYPTDYFYPTHWSKKTNLQPKENSYAMHLWSHSWENKIK